MIWSSLLPPSTPPSSLTVIFCSRYVFSAVRQEASSGRPPNLGILCLTAQGACGYNTVGWHPTGVFIPKWKQSSYLKGKSRFVIASQTVDTIVLLIWLHHWLDIFFQAEATSVTWLRFGPEGVRLELRYCWTQNKHGLLFLESLDFAVSPPQFEKRKTSQILGWVNI